MPVSHLACISLHCAYSISSCCWNFHLLCPMLWAPGVALRCWAVDLAEKVWEGEDIQTLERCQLITRSLQHPSRIDTAHKGQTEYMGSASFPLPGTKAVPHHPWMDVPRPSQTMYCSLCAALAACICVSSSCSFDGSIDCPSPGSWIILPYGMRDEGWAYLILCNAILKLLQSCLLLPLTFQAREVMSEQRWVEGQYQTSLFRQEEIKDNDALLRLEIAGGQKNSVSFPHHQRHCSLPAHLVHGFFVSFLPPSLKFIYNPFQELQSYLCWDVSCFLQSNLDGGPD